MSVVDAHDDSPFCVRQKHSDPLIRRAGCWILHPLFDFFVVSFHFLAQRAAFACRFVALALLQGMQNQWRDGRRLTVIVNRHHREITAVGVAHDLFADVFGDHLDADLHRGPARVVHGRQKGDQFSDVDRLPEHDLVDGQRDDVVARITAGTGVRDLIQILQNRAAVDVACKIRHVWRHQDCHRQLVIGFLHGRPRE